MAIVRQLKGKDIAQILEVERRAFIPSIQATEEVIRERLNKEHIYLGVGEGIELTGTLAMRFARFTPNFADFVRRNPKFFHYAEKWNEQNANAVFIYSLGVVPEHRNGRSARSLLQGAFYIAKQRGMDFLVGDARVPSYNGSTQNPQHEQFERNEELHRAIDNYFKTGRLPKRELMEQDHVIGFYLTTFPQSRILGITRENFWKGDEPCGGHMVIGYVEVK